MGYQSREYYRDNNNSGWSLEDTPVVKFIIIITVAVFLLQIFIVSDVKIPNYDQFWEQDSKQDNADRDSKSKQDSAEREEEYKRFQQEMAGWMPRESPVTKWLELDPQTTLKKGQLWRLITVAFCHSRNSLFHIAFNMIFLFMFGREMERMYGSREFLLFYLTSAVVSSLAYLGIGALTGSPNPAVGASGAVMGVVMLFTIHYPRHTILFFWVIPIEMRYAMAIYVIVDLYPILLQLSGDRISSGIGHAAHLGGALFGFLYYKYNWRLSGLLDRLPKRSPQRAAVNRAPKPSAEQLIYKFPQRTRLTEEESQQVDRILAKISIVGKEGLTDEERETLNRASNTLKWKKEYLD